MSRGNRELLAQLRLDRLVQVCAVLTAAVPFFFLGVTLYVH